MCDNFFVSTRTHTLVSVSWTTR